MAPAINWNAELYDQKHHFVAEYGQELVTLLAPLAGEKILDAGSGTGTLSHQLVGFGAEVTGVDLSAEMVQRAANAYPEIDFKVADLADFNIGVQFDAVFSNATLHWVRPPEKAIACIYHHLRPGGRFVLEMGGQHNIAQIIAALETARRSSAAVEEHAETDGWYFPSPATYACQLEAAGFELQLLQYFERPTRLTGLDGMKNWMEMFGGSFLGGLSAEAAEQVIHLAVEKLRPTHFKEESWWADYRRLRIKAIKPT